MIIRFQSCYKDSTRCSFSLIHSQFEEKFILSCYVHVYCGVSGVTNAYNYRRELAELLRESLLKLL